MLKLLFNALDRATMFLDTVLQFVLLNTQGRKFLFELDKITEQIHELIVAVVLFAFRFEYSCQASNWIPHLTIHTVHIQVARGIKRNDRSVLLWKL